MCCYHYWNYVKKIIKTAKNYFPPNCFILVLLIKSSICNCKRSEYRYICILAINFILSYLIELGFDCILRKEKWLFPCIYAAHNAGWRVYAENSLLWLVPSFLLSPGIQFLIGWKGLLLIYAPPSPLPTTPLHHSNKN